MMRVLPILLLAVLLPGCNTVGPYDASVYRLEDAVYMVNVGTWIGSKRGWPDGNETLKSQATNAVIEMLKSKGLPVESCFFVGYTPYEGGHITITFVAGDKLKAAPWGALPREAFDAELRRRGPLPQVFKTNGWLQ